MLKYLGPGSLLNKRIMPNDSEIIDNIANKEYEFGFVTDIEMDIVPAGLNEEVIRYISEKKEEPEWLLNWRLKGVRAFLKEKMPVWENFLMRPIEFFEISYFSASERKKKK